MKIEVSFGFAALLCFMAWVDMPLALNFLCGAIFHELGHLSALLGFRIPVQGIRVHSCGAVIRTSFTDYWKEFLCAAAGPLSSLLLGFATMNDFPQLAVISFFLGAINLFPIYPMDGGRMLRSILLMHFTLQKTDRIMQISCFVFACLLMLLTCWIAVQMQMGIWPIFLMLFFLLRIQWREK